MLAAGLWHSERLQSVFSSMFMSITDDFGSRSQHWDFPSIQRLRHHPASASCPKLFTANSFMALITHYERRGTSLMI
jgi:hypothetical protein